MNTELHKQFFKEIYGLFIDLKYEKLSEEDIVKLASGAIVQFADNSGVRLQK